MWLPAGAGAGEAAASREVAVSVPAQEAGEQLWAAAPHLEGERLCSSREDMLHGTEDQNTLCQSSSTPGVRELLGITSQLRLLCLGRAVRVCWSCEFCFT